MESDEISDEELYAALDELAAAGILEWRREADQGSFSSRIISLPAVVPELSPLAKCLWLALDREYRRLAAIDTATLN